MKDILMTAEDLLHGHICEQCWDSAATCLVRREGTSDRGLCEACASQRTDAYITTIITHRSCQSPIVAALRKGTQELVYVCLQCGMTWHTDQHTTIGNIPPDWRWNPEDP